MRNLTSEAAQLAVSWRRDPARFVREAFPWGEPGPLQAEPGPDTWQQDILTTIAEGLSTQKALQIAVASGHGPGKTAQWPGSVGERLGGRARCRQWNGQTVLLPHRGSSLGGDAKYSSRFCPNKPRGHLTQLISVHSCSEQAQVVIGVTKLKQA